MWPALRTRLVRQKAITQIMYSVALTSLPQDLTTSRPAYFYWTSCSPQLHQQQSVSQVSLQWTTQNALSDLMQMCSADHAMKAYRPNSAITNWFSGAQTNRHILIFKLTTSNSKLSAHLLMMLLLVVMCKNRCKNQTVSKFVDDVHSRNLIHVSNTNKELKYFL